MEQLPSWLTSTLAVVPALLWVYVGLGVPWSLVALPRSDWPRRAIVLTLGCAFGPMLLTVWLFILGQTGHLTAELSLAGLAALTVIGGMLALRKARYTTPVPIISVPPLALDEKLLLVLISVAVSLRWLSIAFWPFTAYDALWVFGYEGRLYTLLGAIPDTIGYYPQFIPLQYTFAQLLVGGINDHAARAVVGMMHMASILSSYTLGALLFNRRAGIIAAAIWTLYPHLGDWARFGDLEVPLTFSFTLTAAFFLHAWQHPQHRQRYALIAGVLLGLAMWTKPTAGAFIWGVVVQVIVEAIRTRLQWAALRPRFMVAFRTGAACIPLGAVWYIRNVTLGHNAIDMPPAYWLTQAARSGAEFGWPLLALGVLLAFIHFGPLSPRPPLRYSLAGLVLILTGLLPSIITPRYIQPLEWLFLAAGAGLLAWHLWRWQPTISPPRLALIGWAVLLVTPYFVTWFYSYSYHPRLSFAIVPLMILPTAALLALWPQVNHLRDGLRWLWLVGIIVLAVPGIYATLYDDAIGGNWLRHRDTLTDDMAKYQSGNAALMWVVDGLQKYVDQNPDQPLVVAAPGVDRLPFFFPLADIRVDEAPIRWQQLEDATYFIDSTPEGAGLYANVPLYENQVLAGLALATEDEEEIASQRAILRRAWWMDDGIFSYTVYELHLQNRHSAPTAPPIGVPAAEEVVFGDFVRYLGHDIGGDNFWPGRRLILRLYWEVLAPVPEDYSIYLHLRDPEGTPWMVWDGPITRTEDGRYYSTLVWEPGEFITDWRRIQLPPDTNAPVSDDYSLTIGLYNPLTGERVPATVDGQPYGDGYTIIKQLRVVPDAP